MKHLQDTKTVLAIAPALVDDATATAIAVDRTGYDEALFVVTVGGIDIALTALKIQHSNTSDFAVAVDVPGAAVSPLPGTSDGNKAYPIYVDMVSAKGRYLRVVATVGNGSTGATLSAVCILGRAK